MEAIEGTNGFVETQISIQSADMNAVIKDLLRQKWSEQWNVLKKKKKK